MGLVGRVACVGVCLGAVGVCLGCNGCGQNFFFSLHLKEDLIVSGLQMLPHMLINISPCS